MTTEIAQLETELDILMVEDDPADAELAVRELRRHKLANKIHVIADGAEALDYVFCRGAYRSGSFSRPPKVILLDMKLPKVGGLEILKAIKGDSRTRTIPVVVMTSSTEQQDLIESYKLGVNAFIRKPMDFDEFRRIIERVGMFWLAVNQAPPPDTFGADSAELPAKALPGEDSTCESDRKI